MQSENFVPLQHPGLLRKEESRQHLLRHFMVDKSAPIITLVLIMIPKVALLIKSYINN